MTTFSLSFTPEPKAADPSVRTQGVDASASARPFAEAFGRARSDAQGGPARPDAPRARASARDSAAQPPGGMSRRDDRSDAQESTPERTDSSASAQAGGEQTNVAEEGAASRRDAERSSGRVAQGERVEGERPGESGRDAGKEEPARARSEQANGDGRPRGQAHQDAPASVRAAAAGEPGRFDAGQGTPASAAERGASRAGADDASPTRAPGSGGSAGAKAATTPDPSQGRPADVRTTDTPTTDTGARGADAEAVRSGRPAARSGVEGASTRVQTTSAGGGAEVGVGSDGRSAPGPVSPEGASREGASGRGEGVETKPAREPARATAQRGASAGGAALHSDQAADARADSGGAGGREGGASDQRSLRASNEQGASASRAGREQPVSFAESIRLDDARETARRVVAERANGEGGARSASAARAASAPASGAPSANAGVESQAPAPTLAPSNGPGQSVQSAPTLHTPSSGLSSEDAGRFWGSVSRGLAASVRQKGGLLTLKLSPPSMGQLRIEMGIKDGSVRATLHATTESARDMLSSNLASLRATLSSKGLQVESLQVQMAPAQGGPQHASSSTQGEQTGGGDRQSGSQQDAGDGRSRGRFGREPDHARGFGAHGQGEETEFAGTLTWRLHAVA